MNWVLIILLLGYAGIMIGTIRLILLEKGSPSRSLAWIAFLFLLPGLGLVLFYVFGKDVRRKHVFRVKRAETERIFEAFDRLQQQYAPSSNSILPRVKTRFHKLIHMVMKNRQSVFTTGNEVRVFHDGKAFFESMFEDLERAEKHIAIQFYIFEEGTVADRIISILKAKVEEGVKVRVIYDGVGSWYLSDRYVRKLKSYGIEMYPFIPLRFVRWAHKMNYRNHRKIVVVDGKTGYTGGFNISDKYMLGDPILGYWRDTHARITGPAVLGLWLVFLLDWEFVSGQSVKLDAGLFEYPEKEGSAIQVISSGPDSDIANIQQEYFSMITLAKRYIYISTPYFIPDASIMTALKTAALSNVDVKLMIPDNSDSKLLKWSMRSYLEELLEVGVQVFFYTNGFLHSKVLLTDNFVASIGTANMDERSFSQNFEVNAIIYDKSICVELKEQFLRDLEMSQQVSKAAFRNRSRREKVLESMARLFSPLI